MNERTFILGLGAPRCGTTWLYSYLASRSGVVDFGAKKEYHIFDALFGREQTRQVERMKRMVRHALETQDQPLRRNDHLWRKLSFMSDLNAYYDYFSSLVSRQDGPRVTGDLTPANWNMPPAQMLRLKEAFAPRGIRVRSVFLMRDPVDRFVSAVRYRELKLKRRDKSATINARARPQHRAPSWYADVLKSIDQAFDKDEVFVGFYEEMFSRGEVERLCGVVGLPYEEAEFSTRVNSSTGAQTVVDEDLRRDVARHYRPVYDHLAETYGAERMRAIWPGYALLD